MIFKQHFIDLILSGGKTQTRRPNRGYYEVGKTYAIQPCRTCKGMPNWRIMIDAIWEELCYSSGEKKYHISRTNAEAEGGYTVEAFEKAFIELYPKWDGHERWTFKFHIVEVTQ